MLFNSKQAGFQIHIQSAGRKVATVRWPTDEEWAERARRMKTVRRFLGRGQSKPDVLGRDEANRALWEKIVLEAPALDAADIRAFLHVLESTEVLDVRRVGERVEIEMQVTSVTVGGEPLYVTRHVLRLPTQAQMQSYGRNSISRVDGRREQISTVRLEAGGELYDALVESVDGYEGAVPLPHKDDVVSELLAAITLEDDEDPER
jgi:hypothetical protein